MNTEDRIAIIKNKAIKNDREKQEAANAELTRRNELINIIKGMKERIETILLLANTCTENKIKIPEKRISMDYDAGKKWGYPHEFIADGIRHHVGLIRTWGSYKDDIYKYVGINNGGACGRYDFWTNGTIVWAVHENNRNDIKPPRICDLEQFIKEFPEFESGFLKWIDSLAE